MYCIYQITNKINGKRYIGQHKYSDENNPMKYYKGSGVLLHKAYKKYGIENFETEILYKRVRDKATIDAMEIWVIEKYKPEYNISAGGKGGSYKRSLETRRKLSLAHTREEKIRTLLNGIKRYLRHSKVKSTNHFLKKLEKRCQKVEKVKNYIG